MQIKIKNRLWGSESSKRIIITEGLILGVSSGDPLQFNIIPIMQWNRTDAERPVVGF